MTGCPICGAAAPPARDAVTRCDNGHVFSLNDSVPSSPEVNDEHWDELWLRFNDVKGEFELS